MADEALFAIAQGLRAEALSTNQRRALVLAGPADWTLNAARATLAALMEHRGKPVWLSNRDLPEPHLPATAGDRLLGTELDTLIYDAHGGLDPDSLGAALGALRGGGLLILLTPDLDAWPEAPDPLTDGYTPDVAAAARKPSRMTRRLAWVLSQAPGVTLVRAGQPLAPTAPRIHAAPRPQPSDPGTSDQRLAIAAILKTARGRGRRPLVLTSDRGRGKSSALGLAAAELLADGQAQILVTAPRHAAVGPIFAHAGRMLPQAEATPGSLRYGAATLQFLPPDHLAQAHPPADLLLVDEAAGIPAPLLEALLRRYRRIVFATTVHGYEGTGRGFEVRFRATLDRLTPGWRALTLTTPIRWADADPIEALAARALLLDAVPAAGDDLARADPATCTFARLDRDALAGDETQLRQVFGLLVLAHYQTRPTDLRHLLDGPDLRVYALSHRGRIAATALGALEGGLDPDLGAAVFAGHRRPRGHLLPQTLSAHAGISEATDLRYLRLVRIAVHPAVQGRGLGRTLLAGVQTDARGLGLDLLGASFGATANLLHFWQRCGLPAAHIGTSRNAASGAHAAVVLAGLSHAGANLAELARRRLAQRLPSLLAGPLRDLEPEIALALLASGPAFVPDLDPPAWRELAAFAHAARPFEPVIAPLGGLAAAGLSRGPSLRSRILPEDQAGALVAAVLQHRDFSAVAALAGASGRAEVITKLRAAARTLLDDLAPAGASGYVRGLSTGADPGGGPTQHPGQLSSGQRRLAGDARPRRRAEARRTRAATMQTPDYQGGSIVNLMASIMAARGGHSTYPSLRLLPPEEIRGITNLILLVVDGLGADYLARHSPEGPLARHLRGAITSVFPSTTAAAIPCFLTGDAPQQHGLTGWFTWLRELGCIMTVLPGHPRYGGAGYRQAGIDPAKLFGLVPVFQRIQTPSLVVAPGYIAGSDFNLALSGGARILPFETLSGMFRIAATVLRQATAPKYLYLYWPRLDTLGHRHGIEAQATVRHLQEIEQAVVDFLVQAAGTDTVLLITADHGQVDTTPADRIDLADHPTLTHGMALPLCGEPRAAFCYLRPGHVDTFTAYCRAHLAEHLDVVRSEDLIAQGLFGLGEPNPRLAERIGDLTLLMRGNSVIQERLPSETPHVQIGAHGGLSRAEMLVPLCLMHA